MRCASRFGPHSSPFWSFVICSSAQTFAGPFPIWWLCFVGTSSVIAIFGSGSTVPSTPHQSQLWTYNLPWTASSLKQTNLISKMKKRRRNLNKINRSIPPFRLFWTAVLQISSILSQASLLCPPDGHALMAMHSGGQPPCLSEIIHQHDAVTRLAGAQMFEGVVRARHRERLGRRRNAMPRAEIQHRARRRRTPERRCGQ